jgi:hypothetical protein
MPLFKKFLYFVVRGIRDLNFTRHLMKTFLFHHQAEGVGRNEQGEKIILFYTPFAERMRYNTDYYVMVNDKNMIIDTVPV